MGPPWQFYFSPLESSILRSGEGRGAFARVGLIGGGFAVDIDGLIDRVIGAEGGYVNHPSDKGGPTRWGVTEQTARAYGFTGDMRALPRSAAVDIYRKRYWTEPGFAAVAEVLPALAEEMFDTGVNMGTSVPGKFLQRALNVLNKGASLYPDITVDGRIGPATVAALSGLVKRRGAAAAATVLLRLLNALQAVRYVEITEGRAANEDFLFGWVMNRVGALT